MYPTPRLFVRQGDMTMKNKLKIFLFIAAIIAMCTAMVCFVLRHGETDDDNPMFI